MTKLEVLIFVAFAALVCCTDVEDKDQKKRGAGKGTAINSIPSGAQKQDYTYNIYSSSPNSQSNPSTYQSYQSVPNSFYPNQASNQYYSAANTQPEVSSYLPQQQSQLNFSPNTQFLPINFIPNSEYQAKYQYLPTKPNGNIQFAIYQQPGNYPSPQILPYTSTPQLYSPSPPNQVNPHQGYSVPQPQGQFNVAPNYQQVPIGNSYLGQPSTMLFLAQPNLNQLYNNYLYPNPAQNLFNYYPQNAQSKYNLQYTPQASSNEYDKIQGSSSQSIPKEDSDIAHSNEYSLTTDSSSSYKNAYSSGRNTYSKLGEYLKTGV